ncbi:hypothetical protein Leryth_009548 [Lithospermum erythrorhizon]|nr:hypothetical protein Leryth_009548 [Lithospermum erythrorhizon]
MYLPLDLRPKKTRAIRRRLTKHRFILFGHLLTCYVDPMFEASLKTEREKKKEISHCRPPSYDGRVCYVKIYHINAAALYFPRILHRHETNRINRQVRRPCIEQLWHQACIGLKISTRPPFWPKPTPVRPRQCHGRRMKVKCERGRRFPEVEISLPAANRPQCLPGNHCSHPGTPNNSSRIESGDEFLHQGLPYCCPSE